MNDEYQKKLEKNIKGLKSIEKEIESRFDSDFRPSGRQAASGT